MTQSGGGGEYSLGTATLTMRGDYQPLERDLARMRALIAEIEKRGVKIDAPDLPPPPPETKRGYEELTKTIDEMRRSIELNGESLRQLNQNMAAAGGAAGTAAGGNGFGGAAASLLSMGVMAARLLPMLAQLESVQGAIASGAVKFGLVSKSIPILGAAAAAATPVLGGLGKAALALIPGLGQVGLAAMGLNAIFGVMAAGATAAMAPLQQLSAEAGRLNKQVAEAGIFAAQSFAILGPDGKLVEGTARQMQMVRGAILKEYKGIQQEVANISGATASEIYDGFNIILQNISALGEKGTMENSAKLATRMAAGMNTLGIPGFQLRQEVNALMMGNIDRNAMMATKLGITGEDVRQQQAQGTYYDFLMKKLEKLYEGQKVLALSLANVKSNFDDVNQAIASQSGQPLERDTAQMMQTILVTFKNLQQSFAGFFQSIAEAVGPIIKLFGPVVSVLTSIGAIASSVGRVIMDAFGLVTSIFSKLLPVLTAVARTFEVIARVTQLLAETVGAVINPIKALFTVDVDTANDGVNSFFDNMIKGVEAASGAIESFQKLWSGMMLTVGLAGLRGSMKFKGQSEKEIQAAENDYKERFKTQTGLTEAVDLRSLQLPPNITKYLDELNIRLGNGSTRALNISKTWADIKQKAYQNEIKALEQGISLMNKQKDLAEAMSSIAAARRALEARGYELGVQVAASPEAKASADARLADLKLRQEQEAIAERRDILQTERELQQRQMMIQEKQIRIQQEQIKIQLAEAQADQVRVAEATKAALRARGNTSPRSPEWLGFTRELNVLAAEGTRNVARIAGAREALRLAYEAEGQVGTMAGLQAQVLGLQEQQLAIQVQSAQYTREQQRLLAEISAAEQKIANDLSRATNEQNRKKSALEDQSEELNRQNTLLERQGRLQKAQDDLAITRERAAVQTAQRLAELQQLQDRASSGGGTASVIEAQIAAAAAGVSGMESAAEVQQRLYDAKERQMAREHELAQKQLEVQHKREESELRIQKLQMERQTVEIALQRAQLTAEISRLALQQRKDAIAPQLAGASTVSRLEGGVYLQGNIGPTSTGPHFDVKRVGGGFFPRNYLDQFVEVNGKPLSSGTTVPGGTFSGHQARGSHGWDYAFGKGRFAATLKGGAEWMDGKPTEHGERRRFRLPTGEVFQFLHGQSEGIGRAAASAGGAQTATTFPPPNTNPKLLRIMQAARGAGFQGEDLIRMTAVAMAESSGNATAFNNNARTGDLSYGAFQVNMRGNLGPARRRQFGLPNNEALFDLGTNARVAKEIFDSQGINAWGAFRNGSFQQWMGQARAAAPFVRGSVAGTVAAAGGAVAPSTANQADALQQSQKDLDSQETRLIRAIDDNTLALKDLQTINSLEQENLTEQQVAERFQLEYERRKAQLTAEVMQTPQGRQAIATGDAVSGSISGSIGGALQALLNGGDVKGAVSSALAQAGQSLMQSTLDALLNPLLAQLQGGIVKAVTGIDIEGRAQQMAASSLTNAAGVQQSAAGQLMSAAQALIAASGARGPGAVAQGVGVLDMLGKVLPSAIGAFSGLGSFMAPAGAFDIATSLGNLAAAPNLVSGVGNFTPSTGAFTPGLAGGGEIQYGLDYLVGEGNAEIVRFNKAGGRVFSNRALTKALGVPFQRSPGGGAEVADRGGDSMPPIPFLKASSGRGGLPGGGPGGAMAPSRPLKIAVETQTINGVEYATVQQLREATAAAAQAGRDSIAYDMRNSPTFQRSVGLG